MNLFDFDKTTTKNEKSKTEMIVPASIVKGRFSAPVNPDSSFQGITKNNVQIADVFMLFAQRSLQEEINEHEIYNEAMAKIEPIVKKYKLDDSSGRIKSRENQKIITSLLSQEIRKEVEKRFQGKNSVTIDFIDFIDRLNINSLYRNGKTLRLDVLYKIMTEARSNAVLKCRIDNWREDEGKLKKETDYIEYNLIPSFTIVVSGHEEKGEHFETFEDLVKSKKRNKEKYIKSIKFSFNIEALAVFALPRIEDGYSITDRKNREGFSQYAFQLDWLVRSIFKVQHMQSINYYPIEELYAIFGVNYSRYADFKRRILIPATKEINTIGSIHIEVKEHKNNKKVDGISFLVTKPIAVGETENSVISDFSLSYFIAVQHFYSNKYIQDDLLDMMTFDEYYTQVKDFTDEFFKNRNSLLSREKTDLTLHEWNILYEVELYSWKKLTELFKKEKDKFSKLGFLINNERIGFIDAQTKKYIKPLNMSNMSELSLPSEQLNYFNQLWGGSL